MRWSLFDERMTKSEITYKVRMERMINDRWPEKVYMWNGKVHGKKSVRGK